MYIKPTWEINDPIIDVATQVLHEHEKLVSWTPIERIELERAMGCWPSLVLGSHDILPKSGHSPRDPGHQEHFPTASAPLLRVCQAIHLHRCSCISPALFGKEVPWFLIDLSENTEGETSEQNYWKTKPKKHWYEAILPTCHILYIKGTFFKQNRRDKWLSTYFTCWRTRFDFWH